MAATTHHPDIDAVLASLLAGARAALGANFHGLYLHGSLASGDFDPETSDVDFLVVTADEVPPERIPALEAVHARLAAGGSPWAMKLEGRYLPRASLRRWDPADPARPCVHEGRFYLAGQEADGVLQRHELRERAVVVAGPPPAPLIDPVSPADLRAAVARLLRERWAPMLADPARLRDAAYQAYAVLSMCRALLTLRDGVLASKPAAARWAQAAFPGPRAALVARASSWRPGAAMDDLDETLAFLRFAVEGAAGFAGSPR